MGSPSFKRPSGPYADKLWREALRRAVLERIEGEQKLDHIARRVVSQAMDPLDTAALAAAKEIGDRLDGKPAQDVHIDQRVTHDLSRISDAELAAILAEEVSSAGSVKTPDDQGQLH